MAGPRRVGPGQHGHPGVGVNAEQVDGELGQRQVQDLDVIGGGP